MTDRDLLVIVRFLWHVDKRLVLVSGVFGVLWVAGLFWLLLY